jgi:hypothetical protein
MQSLAFLFFSTDLLKSLLLFELFIAHNLGKNISFIKNKFFNWILT